MGREDRKDVVLGGSLKGRGLGGDVERVVEVDREEVRVVVDGVRVKGFMKGFLNFERMSFFEVGGKFRVKGNGKWCGI